MLAANESGVFLLGGADDNGAAINGLMKSGMTDFGIENQKRLRFFFFGLETDGELLLTIFCDGVQAAQYTVSKTTGVQRIRVPISRVHQGRYWQWQVENVDGAFFALYSVEALPVILHSGRG